jgi:hypothetical protein
MQKALQDMGSQRKSECPATRALETMLQEGSRESESEREFLHASHVKRKRSYDMTGLYHAACAVHKQEHDLDLCFPSVEWCCDDDAPDCFAMNHSLAQQQSILENARVPLRHYEKRRKLQSGDAPYLVRTKALPFGLALWDLSDDDPNAKTKCNNLTNPSDIKSGGGKPSSSSMSPYEKRSSQLPGCLGDVCP